MGACGAVTNRPHLRLTVTFDHVIIDGGPAARFIQRFAELIQAGAGLEEAPWAPAPIARSCVQHREMRSVRRAF